jgi:hypothetical protein
MKRSQCKIWCECVGYLPAIVPIENNPMKGQGINIDFTNCREYRQDSDLLNPEVEVVNSAGSKKPIEREFNGYTMQSYPIYPLRFTNYTTRRDVSDLFKKWLLDVIVPLGDRYHFHANQFIFILYEMAKNSADHTKDDAFFGLDFISKNDSFELRFCFADLGEGIKMHVQRNLPPERAGRAPKLDLVETYYYALKYGYTSNPFSNNNKGFGMTAILDGCQGLGIELSVFDAQSRGFLTCITDNHSHAQLRKAFYRVGVQTGFYYYGVLKLKRRPVL